MGRILVIRGGALGDFIVTLPAVRLLRETFSNCHLEILGYRQYAELAVLCGPGGNVPGGNYADVTRSIEYGPLARFFARNAELPAELVEYFSGFNQIVSWLFDPDGIFEANLQRAGVRNFISAYAPVRPGESIARQLAKPLERLALFLESEVVELIPGPTIQDAAKIWMQERKLTSCIAIHPGSGSSKKNWPLENWKALGRHIQEKGHQLLLILGEADAAAAGLVGALPGACVASNLPLPLLAGILNQCAAYAGHDTGISHLAAATGCPSVLIFGPSDAVVWAPKGPKVRITQTPDKNIMNVTDREVIGQISELLEG